MVFEGDLKLLGHALSSEVVEGDIYAHASPCIVLFDSSNKKTSNIGGPMVAEGDDRR